MYFSHIIVGNILYPEYNPLSQAVSDLTALSSPIRQQVAWISNLYGVFSTIFAAGLFLAYYGKLNKLVSIATITFFLMCFVSLIGYSLFPLSAEGYLGTFTDVMHMIVTASVVLLTIATLSLFSIGLFKSGEFKVLMLSSIICLFMMMTGSLMTAFVPANIFGLAERVSLYSLQVYFVVLALTLFQTPETDVKKSLPVS